MHEAKPQLSWSEKAEDVMIAGAGERDLRQAPYREQKGKCWR
jgi:hypothetical protein